MLQVPKFTEILKIIYSIPGNAAFFGNGFGNGCVILLIFFKIFFCITTISCVIFLRQPYQL